ncbi:MAG: trypsin-like peptidase domain-containing protein [Anaerolineales bacterium]
MPKKPALQHLSSALADAVQAAGASVVTVDARPRYPASGVVTAPGFVLTASHAVQEDDIKVTLPDGEELSAELLGRDPHSDLALLKLSTAKGAAAQTNEDPQVGQLALALGRPTSEGMQASLGIISAVGGPLRSHHGGLLERYLRTDAIPYPGFSGGPLVDGEGRVLGINTSGLGMGASLTIPAKLAWKIAAAIQEHGGVKRGYLGVRSQLVELSEENSKALKREQASGLLVMTVEKESPSAAGGLMVGDIIVGFAGQPVAEHDELLLQLNGGVVGKAVDMEVLRGGKPQLVKVTIGEQEEVHQGHGRQRGRRFSHRGWRR